ncbi:MAG: dTDP-4-dehydrorhamnose 3,5-epimerase [Alistipes sp.]|nr:dTDP-4-dehydrorhamnose 3,5-epimerase [Alistipes sp.]
MTVIPTEIPDVMILQPKVHADSRGHFFESFNHAAFEAATGIRTRFIQDNESLSHRGVVRGLHFQLAPHAQSKIVRVTGGRVIDVAVDIRRGSPWFGRYVAVELSADNRRQLFIPRGFAHGFAVMSDEAVVQYKCDSQYAPEAEGGIAWNDPALGIDWGVEESEALLSPKDMQRPTLQQCAELFDYNTDYYA